MAVVCDALSVIVRTETLERVFANGVRGYQAQVPNKTFTTDGLITRVGVMSPNDLQWYIDQLSDQGLRLFGTDEQGNSVAVDVSVVDQRNGLTIATPWLETAVQDGVRIAWLAGTHPGEVHGPEGWSKDITESFIRHEPQDAHKLLFARGTTPHVMSVMDPATGEVAFTPEMQSPYGVTMARAAEALDQRRYDEAHNLLKSALKTRPLQPEHRILSARIQHAHALEDTFVDEVDARWHPVVRAWEEVVRLDDTTASDWIGIWAYALTRCGEMARAREVLSTDRQPETTDPWRLLAELNIAQSVGANPHSIVERLEDLYEAIVSGDAAGSDDPVVKRAIFEALDHFHLPQRPMGAATARIAKKSPKRAPIRRKGGTVKPERDDTD